MMSTPEPPAIVSAAEPPVSVELPVQSVPTIVTVPVAALPETVRSPDDAVTPLRANDELPVSVNVAAPEEVAPVSTEVMIYEAVLAISATKSSVAVN